MSTTELTDASGGRIVGRLLAVPCLAIAVLLSVLGSGTVEAHTGFESSSPSDGDVIDEPVDTVTIVFTGEADPVGDEIVALNGATELQEPVSVDTEDRRSFTVTFDPPLAGGEIGIRWNVQAADAHPIEGAFSFAVDAPVPTTAAPTTSPVSTPSAATGDQTPANAVADTQPAVVVPVSETPEPPVTVGVGSAETDGDVSPGASAETQTLDEFLTTESRPGETTATIGRLVGFLGVTLGLGALAFAATTLRGVRQEVRSLLSAIRVLGAVIAVGAIIEYVGIARIAGNPLTSAWTTAPGIATWLRIAGGIGLAVGVSGVMSRARVQRVMKRPSVVRSLSAAVAADLSRAERPIDAPPVVRWTPDSRSWPSMVGTALIIASFSFDGHTVSKGFRPLHALVNSVHVAAGAVWVGGVVSMAAIVWSRHHAGRPMRVVELVVRFSKVAAIALGSVVTAGLLMAYLVLDTFGELTGTTWGKILLLKSAAVVLAMIGGAYNHFTLLPALDADPDDPETLVQLRSTLTAEAIMLVFVVIVTVWLVAAAS